MSITSALMIRETCLDYILIRDLEESTHFEMKLNNSYHVDTHATFFLLLKFQPLLFSVC
jgi:hypothetical protein